MGRRVGQIIVLILFATAAAWLQFFLIGAWPSFFGQLNLVLLVLIFTLFFFDLSTALWLALVLGLWLDSLSFHFFGLFMIGLCLTAFGTQFALKNWLTNRSLYSFTVLLLGATVLYNFLTGLLIYLGRPAGVYFFLGRSDFWLNLAYQLRLDLLAALFLFHLAAVLTRRVKPFCWKKSAFRDNLKV